MGGMETIGEDVSMRSAKSRGDMSAYVEARTPNLARTPSRGSRGSLLRSGVASPTSETATSPGRHNMDIALNSATVAGSARERLLRGAAAKFGALQAEAGREDARDTPPQSAPAWAAIRSARKNAQLGKPTHSMDEPPTPAGSSLVSTPSAASASSSKMGSLGRARRFADRLKKGTVSFMGEKKERRERNERTTYTDHELMAVGLQF